MGAYPLQLLNEATNFYATQHECYATESRRNTILSGFIGQ
jgi:hypothetical protein